MSIGSPPTKAAMEPNVRVRVSGFCPGAIREAQTVPAPRTVEFLGGEMSDNVRVPFFRPSIGDAEIDAVADVLRSGWLTTGEKTRLFESEFARAVGANHALALNSCTAALHLSMEALRLQAEEAVLVPTMTFGATAEVVRYAGARAVLVDCDPETLLMDFEHAAALATRTPRLVGVVPVHVAGAMVDMGKVRELATTCGLWTVEDAAHSFPAGWRNDADEPWRTCGCGDADVTCFSFYANKTITTGEGGMATTNRADIDERMRVMSLHGISKDAWKRYTGSGSWYYEIVAPGFKYNLTDIAAAMGRVQLKRAEALRDERESIARRYLDLLSDCEEIDLPVVPTNRLHSWHLFIVRLRLEKLTIDRAEFIDEMRRLGVVCSVHWMPLHLHPYYRDTFGYKPGDLPNATAVWPRLVTLPLYPGMAEADVEYVVSCVRRVLAHAHRVS
jgi:dTDP-4-amino-4,6-dideoxygalactose transaminase